jgi:hypothetical protein
MATERDERLSSGLVPTSEALAETLVDIGHCDAMRR